MAVEPEVWKAEPGADLGEDPVPALQPFGTVRDVVLAKGLVQRDEGWRYSLANPFGGNGRDQARGILQPVVIGALLLVGPALDARCEVVRRVGGGLGPEQVEGHACSGSSGSAGASRDRFLRRG